MKALRATQVFTPGAFPSHTYVERSGEKLEQAVRDGLDTPGQVVSLSGPSKSGKTVLVENVVGRELLITVPGAGVKAPENIWNAVLDWINVPASQTKSSTLTGGAGFEAGGSASAKVPGILGGEASAKTSVSVGGASETAAISERRGLLQVVEEIGNSDFVVLIDDFHYMPRDVQVEAAKALKEAVRLGLKICTAAVLHRGDDVVRANPELRGRVRAVDLQYWSSSELTRIAKTGFSALQMRVEDSAIAGLVVESAGSPQLMQQLCLNACFFLGVRERLDTEKTFSLSFDQLKSVYEQTSANTDFRSLVDVIDSGPKLRGTERKMYKFRDGSTGDVYRCILRAVASDPPTLSFHYDELLKRTGAVCDGESPVGSSVIGTCFQMNKLALDAFPNERAIDWDESKQVLDIPDPYLLFFLRWSGRLQEA